MSFLSSRRFKTAVAAACAVLAASGVTAVAAIPDTADQVASLPAATPAAQTTRVLHDSQAAIMDFTPTDGCPIGIREYTDCSQLDTQMGPVIAVNPEDPDNAVAVFQEGRYANLLSSTAIGYAVTFDGGDTWSHGHLPFTKAVCVTSDCSTRGPSNSISSPWVAFGSGNVVYVSAASLEIRSDYYDGQVRRGEPVNGNCLKPPGPDGQVLQNAPEEVTNVCPGGVAVLVSRDGGRSWDPTLHLANPSHSCAQVGLLAVDNGSTSPHRGRVYVACDQGDAATIGVMYSDDGGVTWVDNNTLFGSGVPQSVFIHPSDIRVADNGDLWVSVRGFAGALAARSLQARNPTSSFPDGDPIRMLVYSSADLKDTGLPIQPTSSDVVAVDLHNENRQVRDNDSPAMAYDPQRQLTWLCWSDGRFNSHPVNDIVCSSSPDGQRWSPPTVVNPSADWVNHWDPAVAFSGDGRMLVAYRQRQEAPDDTDPSSFGWYGSSRVVQTMLQTSDDNGTTFSSPVTINRGVVSDIGYAAVTWAAQNQPLAYLGEHIGLAAARSRLYVARPEPVQTDPAETDASFPPKYHHQRIWVAVAKTATK